MPTIPRNTRNLASDSPKRHSARAFNLTIAAILILGLGFSVWAARRSSRHLHNELLLKAHVIARQGVLEQGVHLIQKPFSLSSLAVKVRETLGK